MNPVQAAQDFLGNRVTQLTNLASGNASTANTISAVVPLMGGKAASRLIMEGAKTAGAEGAAKMSGLGIGAKDFRNANAPVYDNPVSEILNAPAKEHLSRVPGWGIANVFDK